VLTEKDALCKSFRCRFHFENNRQMAKACVGELLIWYLFPAAA
jgi:hypothetical protein